MADMPYRGSSRRARRQVARRGDGGEQVEDRRRRLRHGANIIRLKHGAERAVAGEERCQGIED